MHIKIGTRGSKLALTQTNLVKDILSKAYPQHTFELVIITTKGDRLSSVSFQKLKDKNIFIDEIENQLREHKIDLAVHSMKDLPASISDDFILTNCINRNDVEDVLVLKEGKKKEDKLKIGTGSIRRKVQLEACYPNFEVVDIRGNVDTRLRKIEEGIVDGIVIAKAGLIRLGLQDKISYTFSVQELIPACMQGAIAIELRKEDIELQNQINALCNNDIETCLQVEKQFMQKMNGNCTVPLGAICQKDGNIYQFNAFYEDRKNSYFGKGENPEQLLKEAIEMCRGNKNE